MKKITLALLVFLACPILFVTMSAQTQAKTRLNKKAVAVTGETYQSLTFDGAWCWFSDPRAVYYEGNHKRTYGGWIDSYGDVHVGYYDHNSNTIRSTVVYDGLQVDDHDNPSILIDQQGMLYVFFTTHGGKEGVFMLKSKNPESIDNWAKTEQLMLNDTIRYNGLRNSYTYTNPVLLSNENNRMYMFWRGMDFKPNISWSDDKGITWTQGEIFILPQREYANRRPYVKVSSNAKDAIHLAFTDGHPRKEPTNSIYYLKIKDETLWHADGKAIKSIHELPVAPAEAQIVYDAKTTGEKAWIWDITEDNEGNPVIVYARFPDDSSHIYCYARWDGESWQNYMLVNSGKWFPETPQGATEREPNYSGGIVIDHENPDILYLSVNRDSVFEIEKWETKNNGKSWTITPITKGSDKDNVRPFAIRGAGNDNPLQVMWMVNTKYIHYTAYETAIKMNRRVPVDDAFNPVEIQSLMRKVADWQLANPKKDHKLDWHYGAFYTGLMALYKTTGEQRYLNEMINLGQKHNWKLMNDIYHADRLTIAQVFAEIYEEKQDPEMIEKIQWVLDMHIDRKPKADVRFKENPYRLEWWTWCDALYMAPPAFARIYKITGEKKYLDYMNKHWWLTSDYLYSPDDSLFYRDDRFFDETTVNGKKVFWGRGNGWVIAGLARVMDYLPEDYPDRSKYEQQFKEMAAKLLSIQGEDGLWRASLDDPDQLPIGESSASSFFTYALTWGINNGLLPIDTYKPVVKKAWQALVNNVSPEGRLGYVQQVAGSPYEFYDYQWHVYASGAFLLAGKEMIKLIEK